MPLPMSRRFVTDLLNSLPSNAQNNFEVDAGASPLGAVDDAAKKQLLSLQVLFPNEFLPALDLLDRRLVTRLKIRDGDGIDASGASIVVKVTAQSEAQVEDTTVQEPDDQDSAQDATHIDLEQPVVDPTSRQHVASTAQHEPNVASPPSLNTIYYVRSAQQRSSRYTTSYDTTTSYEVRLLAWNCSCPAFAFAAFPVVHPEPPTPVLDLTAHESSPESLSDNSAWTFGGVSLGDAMAPVCKHLLACVLVEKCNGLFGGFVEERMVSVGEAAGWAAGWGD
ncbi:hypothetical protein EK21DRAFT_113773 [Setomelanomma holmii]|uniref:SWIM-type domain-containing protein n=1 Tax=Setomelanomma holmii TaxID=210430 RepID=A0A9P4LKV6_9PLEO|nr:hypothetical protein EK21DRAFT_113773 [Setomelanomma holmii]